MAYVPEYQVEKLWQEMGDNKSWDSFKDVLKKHPEIGQVEDKNLSKNLIMVAERMTTRDFPDSPERLTEVLEQRLAAWDKDTHPSGPLGGE